MATSKLIGESIARESGGVDGNANCCMVREKV